MRSPTSSTLACAFTLLSISSLSVEAGQPGIDVSDIQGTVDWSTVKANGVQFAYMKSSEGINFTDSAFKTNFANAETAGIIRGAYHVANPALSHATAQSEFFMDSGGLYAVDTIPGALAMQEGPGYPECYGLTQSEMITWIWKFLSVFHFEQGVYAVIRTNSTWWNDCTGNTPVFTRTHPLWLVDHATSTSGSGFLAKWQNPLIWQYSDTGSSPGNQDVYNGNATDLENFLTLGPE